MTEVHYPKSGRVDLIMGVTESIAGQLWWFDQGVQVNADDGSKLWIPYSNIAAIIPDKD